MPAQRYLTVVNNLEREILLQRSSILPKSTNHVSEELSEMRAQLAIIMMLTIAKKFGKTVSATIRRPYTHL